MFVVMFFQFLGCGEDGTVTLSADMDVDFLAELHVGQVNGVGVGAFDVVDQSCAACNALSSSARLV